MPLSIEWILNTHKNVKMLEKHVGQKVYQYVLEYEKLHGVTNRESFEYNVHLLEDATSLNKYSKVKSYLIVKVFLGMRFLFAHVSLHRIQCYTAVILKVLFECNFLTLFRSI